MKRALAALTMVILLLGACAPNPTPGPTSPGQPPASSAPSRALVAAVRVEPGSLATRAPRTTGVALYLSKRLFNADLAFLDGDGNPPPYLPDPLPHLNSRSSHEFPDLRMDMT